MRGACPQRRQRCSGLLVLSTNVLAVGPLWNCAESSPLRPYLSVPGERGERGGEDDDDDPELELDRLLIAMMILRYKYT